MPHDESIPEELRAVFSEATGKDDIQLPITLNMEQTRALFERLGMPQEEVDRATSSSPVPDGHECSECAREECLSGTFFMFVNPDECDCKVHHDHE